MTLEFCHTTVIKEIGYYIIYFTEFGKVAVVRSTDKLPGSHACIKTNLIRTDGKCIQFAYMRPSFVSATCNITIKQLPIDVLFQNNEYHITITEFQVNKVDTWQTLMVKLQPGLSKVLIQVQRSESGTSGVVLDNLRISSCTQFGKIYFIWIGSNVITMRDVIKTLE